MSNLIRQTHGSTSPVGDAGPGGESLPVTAFEALTALVPLVVAPTQRTFLAAEGPY